MAAAAAATVLGQPPAAPFAPYPPAAPPADPTGYLLQAAALYRAPAAAPSKAQQHQQQVAAATSYARQQAAKRSASEQRAGETSAASSPPPPQATGGGRPAEGPERCDKRARLEAGHEGPARANGTAPDSTRASDRMRSDLVEPLARPNGPATEQVAEGASTTTPAPKQCNGTGRGEKEAQENGRQLEGPPRPRLGQKSDSKGK